MSVPGPQLPWGAWWPGVLLRCSLRAGSRDGRGLQRDVIQLLAPRPRARLRFWCTPVHQVGARASDPRVLSVQFSRWGPRSKSRGQLAMSWISTPIRPTFLKAVSPTSTSSCPLETGEDSNVTSAVRDCASGGRLGLLTPELGQFSSHVEVLARSREASPRCAGVSTPSRPTFPQGCSSTFARC